VFLFCHSQSRNEVRVGEGGVEAAGEDVEESDGVAGGEPGFDGESEGEGCVVAVGGENEDVQVRLQWWFDCLRLGAVGEAWLPGFVGLLARKRTGNGNRRSFDSGVRECANSVAQDDTLFRSEEKNRQQQPQKRVQLQLRLQKRNTGILRFALG